MTGDKRNSSPEQRKSHEPLLDQSGFAIERLPMLGVIFDQFASNLIEGLRSICRTPAFFAVEELATGDLFATLKACSGATGAVLHSPELDARALVVLDREFASSIVHILLGGDASEPQEPSTRPYTRIELNLIQKISELAAFSLRGALAGIVEASFEVERHEASVDVHTLGRRDAPMVVARLGFQAQGARGAMTLILPQSALLPLRKKLAREAPDESSGDPRWTMQMQNGVSHAEIALKGVLEEIPMTLGEIAAMEVGHVLNLRGSGMGRVRLECGEHDLFWCSLSQVDGCYRLEIEEPIVEERNILDDIFAL